MPTKVFAFSAASNPGSGMLFLTRINGRYSGFPLSALPSRFAYEAVALYGQTVVKTGITAAGTAPVFHSDSLSSSDIGRMIACFPFAKLWFNIGTSKF
jgi:hypothetical protein